MNETEFENMIVRLLGDQSEYQEMLEDAIENIEEASEIIQNEADQIEESWSDSMLSVGTSLTDFGSKASQIGDNLSNFVSGPLAGLFEGLDLFTNIPGVAEFGDLITTIGGGLASVVSLVGGASGGLGVALTTVTTIVSSLVALGPALIPIAAGVAAVVAGIAAVGAGIYTLTQTQIFQDWWGEALEAASNFVQGTLGFFANFKENMATLFNWVITEWDLILSDMGRLAVRFAMSLPENLAVAIDTATKLVSAFIGWLTIAIPAAWEKITVEVANIVAKLMVVVSKITNEMVSSMSDTMLKMIGMIRNIITSTLKGDFEAAARESANLASIVGDSIEEAAFGLASSMSEGFQRGASNMNFAETVNNILTEQAGKFKNPLDGFEFESTLPELNFSLGGTEEAIDEVRKAKEDMDAAFADNTAVSASSAEFRKLLDEVAGGAKHAGPAIGFLAQNEAIENIPVELRKPVAPISADAPDFVPVGSQLDPTILENSALGGPKTKGETTLPVLTQIEGHLKTIAMDTKEKKTPVKIETISLEEA